MSIRRAQKSAVRATAGFTLLEIVLATAMAGVVAAACFMLFASVTSTDRRMAGRAERNAEVEKAHLAFQNAFVAIATSDKPKNRRPAGTGTAVPEGDSTPTGEKGDSVAPPPPPRLVLGADEALTTTSGPRLEMTLSRSPIGGVSRRSAGNIPDELMTEETSPRVNNSSDGGMQAVRGAFVMRPQERAAGADARAGSTPLNQVWWIPLPPPAEEGKDPLPMSASAGYPVLLASDVTRLKVRFFHDGEWKEELKVTWEDELPAYAEVGLEFASGNQYRWLLEIDYVVMAEVTANGLEEGADGAGGTGGGRTRTTGGGRFTPTREGISLPTRGSKAE